MASENTLRAAGVILFGALLYVGLIWVPLAGPLVAGFIVGWLYRKNPKDNFKAGVYSGITGFILLSLLFSWWRLNAPTNEVFSSFLAAWIILLWNILGVLFSGLGAAAAGVFGVFGRLLGFASAQTPPVKTSISYRICERCGNGLIEGSGECSFCGREEWVA